MAPVDYFCFVSRVSEGHSPRLAQPGWARSRAVVELGAPWGLEKHGISWKEAC